MPGNAKIDANYRRSLLGVLDDVSQLTQPVLVNPVTKRLLVSAVITSNNTGIGNTIPGGTVGSVLFLGIGSTLAQDNANFFYDDTQHFLGIGTNTPNANLHVDGSVQLDLGGDATGDIFYRGPSGNIVNLPIGTAGQQLTVVGGLPAWSLAGSVGYDLFQNVGVSVTQRSTVNLTNLLTASDVGGKTQLDINVTNLANNSTFVSTLTANSTFLTNIANSSVFVNALVANNTFTTALANNTNFINALTANSTFINGITTIINNAGGAIQIDLATQVTGVLPLANGGSGSALTDPGFNAVWVWDDTTNTTRLAQLSGLTYNSGTNTLTASGGSSGITSINGDTTAAQTLTAGSGIFITDNGTGDHTITATGSGGLISLGGRLEIGTFTNSNVGGAPDCIQVIKKFNDFLIVRTGEGGYAAYTTDVNTGAIVPTSISLSGNSFSISEDGTTSLYTINVSYGSNSPSTVTLKEYDSTLTLVQTSTFTSSNEFGRGGFFGTVAIIQSCAFFVLNGHLVTLGYGSGGASTDAYAADFTISGSSLINRVDTNIQIYSNIGASTNAYAYAEAHNGNAYIQAAGGTSSPSISATVTQGTYSAATFTTVSTTTNPYGASTGNTNIGGFEIVSPNTTMGWWRNSSINTVSGGNFVKNYITTYNEYTY